MMLDSDLNKYRSQIESMRSPDSFEYAHLGKQIYLDHAANTIYPASLVQSYATRLTSNSEWSLFSNPHSHSQSGTYTNALVDSVREKILSLLFESNSSEYDLVFVCNATAGLKLLGECLKPDCLAYLLDNHTSVIGMREIIEPLSHVVYCVTTDGDTGLQFKLVKSSSEQRNGFKKNLFVFPAQSNFDGRRYDMNIIDRVQSRTIDDDLMKTDGEWFVCLDASSYMSTSPLSLKNHTPDFVVLSFYKLFGFPTSLGALLIRKTDRVRDHLTAKRYFGGGTVETALVENDRVVVKNFTCQESNGLKKAKNFLFHEAFEDGTLPYLEIIATGVAIDQFQKLTFGNGFSLIGLYLKNLSEHLINRLKDLKHFNGNSLVEIYRRELNGSILAQYGPIISFNLRNSKGDYIGFKLVEKLAQEAQIHVRTGCFCNIGACQTYLPHLTQENNFYFSHGHKCGDHIDLIDRKPTGAIRVSLGYCSTQHDCDRLVEFLKNTFIDSSHPLQYDSRSIQRQSSSSIYIKITAIFIYPIKSCAPMRIEYKWPLSNNGFIYDREWIIVDNDRIPLSQKRAPELTNIRPFIDLDRNVLQIRHGEEDFYELKLNMDARNRNELWIGKSHLRGYDQGDEVSAWLSRAIGNSHKCRLIRCEMMSAANKAQFLLVNENSVRSLSRFREGEDHVEKGIDQLSIQFRPNLVVKPLDDDDNDAEFDEERWSKVNILNRRIEFNVVENCVRCHMINIDQQSKGENSYSGLLKQLYKLKDNSRFGIYLNRRAINDENQQHVVSFVDNELEVGDIGVALRQTTTTTTTTTNDI